MTNPAAHLSAEARHIACRVMVESLRRHAAEVIALCVDDHHFHLLVRFPESADRDPATARKDGNTSLAIARHCVGIAKKDSARALSDGGLVSPGGVRATRARCLPVRDRVHQLNVFRYIQGHAKCGAAVWTILQEQKKPADQSREP